MLTLPANLAAFEVGRRGIRDVYISSGIGVFGNFEIVGENVEDNSEKL
jgi:hypothetical protein